MVPMTSVAKQGSMTEGKRVKELFSSKDIFHEACVTLINKKVLKVKNIIKCVYLNTSY